MNKFYHFRELNKEIDFMLELKNNLFYRFEKNKSM